MPYIKIFIKEELKFSKQEIDLVNSNTEIIKSLKKEFEFLKQKLLNKNKLIELYRQKYLAMLKVTAMVAISILIPTYQL